MSLYEERTSSISMAFVLLMTNLHRLTERSLKIKNNVLYLNRDLTTALLGYERSELQLSYCIDKVRTW